jgi:predicted aspartyl protease
VTLRFDYRGIVLSQPSVALGGRSTLSRPVISITLIGLGGTQVLDGLIDSGADAILVPEYVAADIGIDLTTAAEETTRGIGGSQVTARYADVTVRIAAQNERREWSALVGFAPIGKRNAILGHAGFLQYFTTVLHGDLERVELTINGLYPGI